jgi:hypothetical protein
VVYEIAITRIQHQIDHAVEEHAEAPLVNSHEQAGEDLQTMHNDVAKMKKRITEDLDPHLDRADRSRKALYEMIRLRAGEKAAEFETNRKFKARARDRAYDKFEHYVEQGETLDNAYRKAVGGSGFFR